MTVANVEGAGTASSAAGRQMRNAIIASVLGWSLDFFDLFILLYVAPVVGALFFPSSVPTLSLAAVYASFAVTLLMRPVGSAIFGHYASVLGALLDLPAGLRRLVIRRFLLSGIAFEDVVAHEDSLADFVRRNVFGVWHPSGTCRMGDPSDSHAVVDPGGRVIGSENLYVADASVMPRLPTANTNIPTMMIAEKLGDALLSPRKSP